MQALIKNRKAALSKLPLILCLVVFVSGCISKEISASRLANEQAHKDIIGHKIEGISGLERVRGNAAFSEKNFKWLTVLDSECGTCYETLFKWDGDPSIDGMKSVKAIFILQGGRTPLLSRYLKEQQSNKSTIFLDTTSMFLMNNDLFSYYQKTLLLSPDNKVVYVGSPINNELVNSDVISILNEK